MNVNPADKAREYATHPEYGEILSELQRMSRYGIDLTEPLIEYTFETWDTKQEETIRRACKAEPRTKPKKPNGYVYFINHGNKIKIGWSKNPAQRVKALSLRLNNIIGVIEGTQDLEHEIQQAWASQRIDDTEWFHETPELHAYIKRLATPFHYKHKSRTDVVDKQTAYQTLYKQIRNEPGALTD